MNKLVLQARLLQAVKSFRSQPIANKETEKKKKKNMTNMMNIKQYMYQKKKTMNFKHFAIKN